MNFRVSGADKAEGLASSSSESLPTSFFTRRHQRDMALAAEAQHSGLVLSQVLAQGLSTSPAGEAAQALAQRVAGQNETLSHAFQQLSSTQQSTLTQAIGEETWNQVLSLSQEHNADIFNFSLMNLGRTQEGAERLPLAATCYRAILENSQDAELRSSAQARLDLFNGGGNFGDQFEFFGQQSLQHSVSMPMLFSMGLATATFQTIRLMGLSRFAAASSGLWTRGIVPQAISWGVAFGAETTAFTLGMRGLNSAFGQQNSSSLGHDFLSAGLTLFLLKSSGSLSENLVQSLRSSETRAIWYRNVAETMLPQTAMFMGITGAHLAEIQLGWRDPSSRGSILVQSLSTLLSFNVSGRLLDQAGGGAYGRHLAVYEKMLQVPPNSGNAFGTRIRSLADRILPKPVFNAMTPEGLNFPTIMQMSMEVEDSGRPNRDTLVPSGRAPDSYPPSHADELRALFVEIRDGLDPLNHPLYKLASGRADELWTDAFHRTARDLSHLVSRTAEAMLAHRPDQEQLHFLQDIAEELRNIQKLTQRTPEDTIKGTRFIPESKSLEVQRAGNYLLDGLNMYRNFLNDEGHIVKVLNDLLYTRVWTQRALNIPFVAETENGAEFSGLPYLRIESNGALTLPKGNLNIVVLGDRTGPRTKELASLGHEVIHMDPDLRYLELARRAVTRWETETRDKGEPFTPANVHYVQSNGVGTTAKADIVESYYPIQDISALPPRSSPAREQTLREFLDVSLLSKIGPRGTGFVISERDDMVEDLAGIIRRDNHLELVELQRGRNSLPLVGGHGATSDGEDLVSWLLFRKKN